MGKEFERIWSCYAVEGDATTFQYSDMFSPMNLCPFQERIWD